MKNDLSWRGMLIKDNEGDWGICVATWRGMKSGKPGVPGTKGHPGTPGVKGNPGHFAMKFVNLRDRSRKPVFVVLPREGRKYAFSIDTLKGGHFLLEKQLSKFLFDYVSCDKPTDFEPFLRAKPKITYISSQNFTLTPKVNLKKGQVTVAPEERDVVQHMALAFVTTTLYLLVQPRPKNLPKIVKRGDKKVRWTIIHFSPKRTAFTFC